MKRPPGVPLHPCLRAFPGVVVELSADGHVRDSNGRLEDSLGRELVGRPLHVALDVASRAKLERLLASTPPERGEQAEQVELILDLGTTLAARAFYVVRDTEPETDTRFWLMERPRDPAGEQLHEALHEANAELINSQREVTKKSSRLARALDEIENKLAENERLSEMLQYQNEEMEAQNEELLAMTEELHAGQEELLHLNHLLERRTRELQVAISARNRFYAAMSHELRTPINAVMGYNDLLLAGIYGPLGEQQELAVERAQRAVRHLRELVNDVLDISKIEAGKLEVDLEEVGLHDVVEELFATLQPLADARGATLSMTPWSCPDRVTTDPRRLRQILMNLLSNAIKYGGGRPVWVRCAPSPEGGVALEVVDNGDGIAADDLSSIFDEFVQLGPQPGGTGLGLPIARRLALLLGGRLEAFSTPGAGSTFRLSLPRTLPVA